MEMFLGLMGTLIFGVGLIRSLDFIRGRDKKKALPSTVAASTPLPLPPLEPTFEERLGRIGIHSGSEPQLLGSLRLSHLKSEYSFGVPMQKNCTYCNGSMFQVHEIRKKEIPSGARDLGITVSERLAVFCSVCGATSKDCKSSEAIGPAFAECKNFLELIETLERRRQTIGGEERQTMIKKEMDRLDGQRVALQCELMDLEHQLNPITDANPYRKAPTS